ncbi:M23 family metallopeptidase [Kitasatospora sp. NPDC050543]|uniref:M23 family metallopeptidase n=1 Tax=Kitasatospora sp. NPDC050543 TaxID=3364054 RepID=UPI00378EDE98
MASAGARPTRAEMRNAARAQSRAQRRDAAKAATRSALLSVALPSVAALGVAGAAATTVHGDSGRQTVADPAPVTEAATAAAPVTVPAELPVPSAGDEAGRAARGETRPALSAEEPTEPTEAPKPVERPKVSLPVAAHGLSATFGQAGTHWTARHTGIDFPVQGGTPVLAATDGTVRTQWNSAYGYMAIVKSPDGVESWYCHLRSYKIRKGPVKAGDVIAYSGTSGNSTGAHLHFEIRPDGGAPVDPLAWLLGQGLDPR